MKKVLGCIFILAFCHTFAQDTLVVSEDITINKHVDGTLLQPKNKESRRLAIIIPGSGPTDRNGNQNFMKNNSLKKLAEALTNNGIATFRYDKRVVKQIREHTIKKDTKFDDFITDAISVLNYFKNSSAFSDITIIGHSQGSLVGMVAAQEGANKFISIAGAGQPIDEVLIFQVGKSAPMFLDDTKRILETLRNGETTSDYPPQLATLFNLELQPFFMNWMQYKPTEEIKKLNIPILVINGTKDLQVTEDEAQLLSDSNPKASLRLIENMNHIMFLIEGDDLENAKSYNESTRPISKEIVNHILEFIKQ